VGQWFVFWNFNGYYNMDMWQYGIDPGSDVLMRLYVPADGELTLYVAWDSQNRLYEWEDEDGLWGTRADGDQQRLRRVTSLLRNSPGAMYNTIWDGVQIATPSDQHLWEPDDTDGVTTTDYVTVTETNQYYDETIDIDIDE